MTTAIGSAASTLQGSVQQGQQKGITDMEVVAKAKSDVDEVAVFTKFIKRAEDTAQAAL
ncbi:MAG: hypothetical protein ACRYF5_16580 [Janthinobacterium lividum]